MTGATEERRYFESRKAELLRAHAGHFAVICGRRLVGVFPTLDQALGALADGFDDCNLPEGVPIFISQIADEVSLRVIATREKIAPRAAAY